MNECMRVAATLASDRDAACRPARDRRIRLMCRGYVSFSLIERQLKKH